jgi:hypothetical protein
MSSQSELDAKHHAHCTNNTTVACWKGGAYNSLGLTGTHYVPLGNQVAVQAGGLTHGGTTSRLFLLGLATECTENEILWDCSHEYFRDSRDRIWHLAPSYSGNSIAGESSAGARVFGQVLLNLIGHTEDPRQANVQMVFLEDLEQVWPEVYSSFRAEVQQWPFTAMTSGSGVHRTKVIVGLTILRTRRGSELRYLTEGSWRERNPTLAERQLVQLAAVERGRKRLREEEEHAARRVGSSSSSSSSSSSGGRVISGRGLGHVPLAPRGGTRVDRVARNLASHNAPPVVHATEDELGIVGAQNTGFTSLVSAGAVWNKDLLDELREGSLVTQLTQLSKLDEISRCLRALVTVMGGKLDEAAPAAGSVVGSQALTGYRRFVAARAAAAAAPVAESVPPHVCRIEPPAMSVEQAEAETDEDIAGAPEPEVTAEEPSAPAQEETQL